MLAVTKRIWPVVNNRQLLGRRGRKQVVCTIILNYILFVHFVGMLAVIILSRIAPWLKFRNLMRRLDEILLASDSQLIDLIVDFFDS
jgi:hypothetical protein